ncbi:MAG: tetratricopeptide repeat protein [Candidatus Thorarchaeota archaeon]
MTLNQIRKLILQREFDLALEEISQLPDADRIEGQTYKGIVLSKQNNFTEALSVVDQILSEDDIKPSHEFIARIGKIIIFLRMRNYPGIFVEMESCDQLLGRMDKNERASIKRWEGHLLSTKGMFHVVSGEQDEAVENYSLSAELFDKVGDKYDQLLQIINISWIYRAQGLLDQALDYSIRQLKISEDIGEERYLGWSNFNIGMIYFYKADLVKAAHHAEIGEQIFREIGHQEGLTTIQTLIGSVYRSTGDFAKALAFYDEVMQRYKETLGTDEPLPHSCCLAYRDSGIIYMYQNRLDRAIDFFEKGLEVHRKRCKLRNTVIDYEITVANLYSVYAKTMKGDTDNLQEHVEDIRRTAEQYPWLDVFSKTTEAFILQNKPRAKDKAKALELYEEVLDEKFDYELELFIQVHLSELLLDELKLYGEESVLNELKDVLSRISETADKQRSIISLIWLYILQAKLAVIEGDTEHAEGLLDRALTITEEKDLALLSHQVRAEQQLVSDQLKEWKTLFVQNATIQEQIELLQLKEYITEAVTSILEKRFESADKFKLVFRNLLKDRTPVESCRVGVAQIGLSDGNNLLEEYFFEIAPGIFRLKDEKVESVRKRVVELVDEAVKNNVNILLFPELSIDLGHQSLYKILSDLSSQHNMYIIPGSYHDTKNKKNTSTVFSPDGILWEQEKHIPATIHFKGNRIEEGIEVGERPHQVVVSDTEYGRIAIAICRDFLDLDLRVELKNSEQPIDIILNPAFTPVTADFKAAHFDARRSIYAYCFFANVAEFGNSSIYTPEKERTEYEVPAKQEGLIFKDVDLFKLRSERRKWEKKHTKNRQFIQSTRS